MQNGIENEIVVENATTEIHEEIQNPSQIAIGFIAEADKEKLMELSNFIKTNNYKYGVVAQRKAQQYG